MNNTYQDQYMQTSRIIYTPSIFAKENLFYLQEIGKKQDFIPHSSNRSHLDSYLFILIESGCGYIHYQGQTYTVKQNDIILIDCQRNYSLLSDSNNLWSLSWIHFNGPNMKQIYNKYIQRCNSFYFHCFDITPFKQIHQNIINCTTDNDYVKDMHIMEQLTQLFSLLMKNGYNITPNTNYKDTYEVSSIYQYLTQHYLNQISLDQLSQKFSINKYYLTRIFKQNYNTSITQYLLNLRINHSKELLRYSNDSIQQIALDSGFNDVNYFIRAFKKIETITPLQYRNQWKA